MFKKLLVATAIGLVAVNASADAPASENLPANPETLSSNGSAAVVNDSATPVPPIAPQSGQTSDVTSKATDAEPSPSSDAVPAPTNTEATPSSSDAAPATSDAQATPSSSDAAPASANAETGSDAAPAAPNAETTSEEKTEEEAAASTGRFATQFGVWEISSIVGAVVVLIGSAIGIKQCTKPKQQTRRILRQSPV